MYRVVISNEKDFIYQTKVYHKENAVALVLYALNNNMLGWSCKIK